MSGRGRRRKRSEVIEGSHGSLINTIHVPACLWNIFRYEQHVLFSIPFSLYLFYDTMGPVSDSLGSIICSPLAESLCDAMTQRSSRLQMMPSSTALSA